MNQIFEFKLDDNEVILAEITNLDPNYDEEMVSSNSLIKKASIKISNALAPIRSLAKVTIDSIKNLPDKPKEVTIEFGLKLQADTNAIIASIGAEGNIKVTLKWVNNEIIE
jgi:hypothetical protein